MLQVCPITRVERDGCIPATYVKVPPTLQRHGFGAIEACETFGDVMDRLGCTDEYGVDRDAFVLSITTPTNVHCGGTVLYALHMHAPRVHRMFGSFSACVYVAQYGDLLYTSIPG